MENFIYHTKMLSMIRASYSLMDEIRDIINSNYHLYENILLIQEDHNEHSVNEQWVEQADNTRKISIWENFDKDEVLANFYTSLKYYQVVE